MSDSTFPTASWFTGTETPGPARPSWIFTGGPPCEAVPVVPSAPLPATRLLASIAPPAGTGLLASIRHQSLPPVALQPAPPPYPDLREENALLRSQLATAAQLMARLRSDVLRASEGELVKLALCIAERVARRELATERSLVVAWAREAIESLASEDDEVVVAVAPDLAAVIDTQEWRQQGAGTVTVKTDPSLSSFACEIRTKSSTVDVSLDGRLAAITRALTQANE